MEKKLSVITVCYNAGDDLAKTVQSVLSQTETDFEYIIQDGGSTDGSIEHLPIDDRIRLFQMNDKGVFDAMNKALEVATGDYVNFLNAGDTYFSKDVLSRVYKEFKLNPDVEFFYGNFYKMKSKAGFISAPSKLSRYYLFTHSLCHQAWFLDRSIQLNIGGYSTETRIGGDYLMLLDLVIGRKVKTKKIKAFLVKYQGGGLSSREEEIVESETIRTSKRMELFSNAECTCYSMVWKTRSYLKIVLYDKYIYNIFRKILTMRYKEF